MQDRKFSLISFSIGLLVGLLIPIIIVASAAMYFYQTVRSGTWDDRGGIVRDIGNEVRAYIERSEERPTSVYGTVTRVEESLIEIEAPAAIGTELLQFRYDENTVAVRLNNDDESTEIPIRVQDLEPGEGITVVTNEETGSVADQYAVKIVNF